MELYLTLRVFPVLNVTRILWPNRAYDVKECQHKIPNGNLLLHAIQDICFIPLSR